MRGTPRRDECLPSSTRVAPWTSTTAYLRVRRRAGDDDPRVHRIVYTSYGSQAAVVWLVARGRGGRRHRRRSTCRRRLSDPRSTDVAAAFARDDDRAGLGNEPRRRRALGHWHVDRADAPRSDTIDAAVRASWFRGGRRFVNARVGKLTRPLRSGGSGGARCIQGAKTLVSRNRIPATARRSSTSECALPARGPARPTIYDLAGTASESNSHPASRSFGTTASESPLAPRKPSFGTTT